MFTYVATGYMVASWLGMRLNDGPGDLLVSYEKNDDKVHPGDFPGCSATLFFMQRGFFLTMLKCFVDTCCSSYPHRLVNHETCVSCPVASS